MKNLLITIGLGLLLVGCISAAEQKFASPSGVTNIVNSISVTKTNSTNFLASFTLLRTNLLVAVGTLNFAEVAANSYIDLQITVTGAALNDAVFIGVNYNAAILPGLAYFGFVDGANSVTIRAFNVSATPQNPPSETFTAVVLKP